MPGAERLRDCAVLEQLVKKQRDAGKPYAAICATPYVFLETKVGFVRHSHQGGVGWDHTGLCFKGRLRQ